MYYLKIKHMRFFLQLVFPVVFGSGFAQPSPRATYPALIQAITNQLKTDSLNYSLLWKRLAMKVNLFSGFPNTDEVFSYKVGSNKTEKKERYFDEYNTDFNTIYTHVIQAKKFDITEEGDFYLSRMWFCFAMLEYDCAIEAAEYLRDSASYSKYWGRGEYYNDWALFSLFNLNVINQQYDEALKAVNSWLAKKKRNDPKAYFGNYTGLLSYGHKIRLFEHFNKQDEIIPFLKQLCRAYFNWYFERAEHKDADFKNLKVADNEYYSCKSDFMFSLGTSKQNSFQLLKQTVAYMRKYEHEEFSKFEKTYQAIRYQANENHETINPNISDEKLELMLIEILE